MTQENKELLMRDLSSRIPYGVIVNVNGLFDSKLTSVSWYGEVSVEDSVGLYPISEVKSYLFPLSSMTEEQCYKFYCRFVENETDYNDFKKYYFGGCLWSKVLTSINDCNDIIDWFHKNHFDYRGLIEKGLAIDATGLNIY